MVSFQTPTFPEQRKPIPEFQSCTKKRIWEDNKEDEDNFEKFKKQWKKAKVEKPKSLFDMEFQLEKPLPLEWQQCLDIKSGQIHFYNTKTHKRTCKDPRQSPETSTSTPGDMSLDLELHLPCQSLRTQVDDNWTKPDQETKKLMSNGLTLSTMSSSLEADDNDQEMVAVVCMRCHMLVMLCKSSPSCPNCKFMYPQDQFKQSFRLSCSKK